MEKTCNQHGTYRGLVWSSVEQYVRSFDFRATKTPPPLAAVTNAHCCPLDCGLCPAHEQHTCLAIIEVIDGCNLQCSVCLASSPKPGLPSLETIEHALRALLKNEGKPAPLQFSGGEPTTRKNLPEIISVAHNLGFRYLEVNSNGVELARKPDLAERLAEAGLNGVYLQFDGVSDDVYRTLRGADLVDVKKRAVENARRAGLNVVLACTVVKGVNDGQMWNVIRYAFKRKLAGVNFQPVAFFGRYALNILSTSPMDRITNPDVAYGVEAQSGGELRANDFIPVPCPDNRCQLMAYVAVKEDKVVPVNRRIESGRVADFYSRFTDVRQMKDALKEIKMVFNDSYSGSSRNPLPTVTCCSDDVPCCPQVPLPNTQEEQYLVIGCHGMMDAWTADVNRLKRCCVHELTLDGRLVPFCLYNTSSLAGSTFYRPTPRPTELPANFALDIRPALTKI